MTDTTAPRTAAPPETVPCWFCGRVTSWDELIAGYDTWDEQRLACPRCDAAIKSGKGYIGRVEREAIEPLLALVRAAQDYLDIEDETFEVEGGRTFTARWAEYDARADASVAATRAALAALPESVREQAR